LLDLGFGYSKMLKWLIRVIGSIKWTYWLRKDQCYANEC
jgi:hypothetical protein